MASGPARRCLVCDATQPILASEPVWPLGWRCPQCSSVVAQRDGVGLFAPDLADTISGFDPLSFDPLADIEAEHFWFVTRNELIVGLADKYFPQARRFLEVGCGNGAVLRAVAGSRKWERLVGSELHPSGLVHARVRLPEAEPGSPLGGESRPYPPASNKYPARTFLRCPEDGLGFRSSGNAIPMG